MRVLSWDVGIKNLSYCVLTNENNKIEILDWEVINLLSDGKPDMMCICHKRDGNVCGKNAKYILGNENDSYTFCATHVNQSDNYYTPEKNLFKITNNTKPCTFIKRNNESCNKKAKYRNDNTYYCKTHYDKYLRDLENSSVPRKIKKKKVTKEQTLMLKRELINRLDKLSLHFAMLKIDEVIVENQPSKFDNKEKVMASTLIDYFIIRGIIDKYNGLNLRTVKGISANNKLKIDKKNTALAVNGLSKSKRKRVNKALAKQYTPNLIKDQPECVYFLNLHTKKDDLCDSYLQGRYYLESINI